MPDPTSPEPNLPTGWLAASSAFDDEVFGDDSAHDTAHDSGRDTAHDSAGTDATPADSAVLDQFELVRSALNTPLDVPAGLLRAQIDHALDLVERETAEPAARSSIAAPVIPLKPRRERSNRWLAAAASVAIVGAGLLAINQTINQGSDDTARGDAAVSSESSDSLTSPDSDLAEKSADDSATAGGATNDQPLEPPRGTSATDMGRAATGAEETETAAQDAAAPSAPAAPPALGEFADDQQLMLAIAQLDAYRIASAPSPAASESPDIERPAGGAPAPAPTCPTDPSDVVVGQASVAGVATLVVVRDNETRFINLVTCVARAAPAAR